MLCTRRFWRAERPSALVFVVHYELTSRRSAILSLSLEQLRLSAGGCKSGPSHQHSGILVTAVNITVRKGSRDIKASITWPGDTRGDRFRVVEETSDCCYTFGAIVSAPRHHNLPGDRPGTESRPTIFRTL